MSQQEERCPVGEVGVLYHTAVNTHPAQDVEKLNEDPREDRGTSGLTTVSCQQDEPAPKCTRAAW